MIDTMYKAMGNSITVMFVSWISMLLVGRIFDFHQIYIGFIDQIKSEEWLLKQCENDHFFHNMAYHTDVCKQVLANSQLSPVLYSIHGSLMGIKLCGFYDCTDLAALVYKGGVPVIFCFFLLYLVTPSFLIPLAHVAYDKHQKRVFEDRCSPVIHDKEKLYKRLSNMDMGLDFD
jgi:hypothetical protein